MINWKKYPKKKILGTGDSIIVSRPDGTTINFDSPISVDNTGNATFSGNVTIQGNLSILNSTSQTISFGDNDKLYFGDGNDLEIFSDGNDGFINNNTNHFYITNNANDCDLVLRSDDGSGGVTAYLTLDGSAGYTVANKDIYLVDDVRLRAGTGGDFSFFHDGSNSKINNNTGNIRIENFQDDGDIQFFSDDGSGGTTEYFRIDGGDEKVYVYKDLKFGDNISASFGNNDYLINHNGTNSILSNYTGNLQINNYSDDGDIILSNDDGSGGLAAYLTLDGSVERTIASKNIRFEDSVEAQFGGIADLTIAHDATNSTIANNTGDLYIKNRADDKDIIFQSDDGSGGVTAYLTIDGSAATNNFNKSTFLPDDNVHFIGNSYDLRIYHSSSGVSYIHNDTGDLRIENDATDGDIIFRSDDGSGGLSTYFRVDGGLQKTIFPDNQTLAFGSVGDLNLYHDASNSFISNGTGDLYIINGANDKDIIFQSDDGSGGLTTYLTLDGSATTVNVAKKLIVDTGSDNLVAEFKSSGDSIGEIRIADSSKYTRLLTVGDTFKIMPSDGDEVFNISDSAISVLAPLTVGVDDTGHDVIFYGATSGRYLQWDESQDMLLLRDNTELKFGNGSDLRMYFNGTNGHIKNESGKFYITNYSDDEDIIFRCDDGSGGVTEYLTLDGSTKYARFSDNIRVTLGDSDDLQIKHDGTDSDISNYTGDLYIQNHADDKDIIFKCDDGSGGNETYFFLDGNAGGANPTTIFPDDSRLAIGSGQDLKLYHSSGISYIDIANGNLTFRQTTDDGDIIFQCDDGSGGLAEYFRVDGGDHSITFSKEIKIASDSHKLTIGASRDLQLYHDGSHSYIVDNGTGNLWIGSNGGFIALGDEGANETFLKATDNGSVELYYDNSKKLETTSSGVDVTGDLGISGNLTVSGTTTTIDTTNLNVEDKNITLNYSSGDSSSTADGAGITIQDAVDSSTDATILWDATNDEFDFSHGATFAGPIEITSSSVTDFLKLTSGGSSANPVKLIFEKSGSEQGIIEYNRNGDLEIYNTDGDGGVMISGSASADPDFYISHAGASTFKSTLTVGEDDTGHDVVFYGATSGRYLQWDESQDRLEYKDSVKAIFGSDNDLHIYHDGSNSYIKQENSKTGNLYIRQETDDADIIFQNDDGSGGVAEYFRLDGGMAAHDGSATTALYTIFPDKSIAAWGTGADLRIDHSGSHSYIYNTTGNLEIINYADDSDIIFKSDDGSGGVAEYFRLDGSSTQTIFSKNQQHADNVTTYYGNAGDLSIYHDGSNSYIKHVSGATGDLIIEQGVDDKDIIFRCDDGSGGTETYFYLDGSSATGSNEYTVWPDSSNIALGTGKDLQLYHNGSTSFIYNNTGDLQIVNSADDSDILFRCDDGSGGLATYFSLDGGLGYTFVYKNFRFNDAIKAEFGGAGDLELSHDGTDSWITNNTGDLKIYNNANDKDIIFASDDGSGGVTAYITLDGSSTKTNIHKNLRFDDSVRAEFGNSGDLVITHDGTDSRIENGSVGDLKIQNAADDKDILFRCDDGSGGVTTYFQLDGSAAETVFSKAGRFADNVKARFGNGGDMYLQHDGTDSFIVNTNGDLTISNQADDKDIIFQSDDGSGGVETYFFLDGSASAGAPFTVFPDSSNLTIGTGFDLRLKHDGSHSYIQQTGTGDLYIQNTVNDKDIIFQSDDGSGGTTAYLTLDGSATTVEIAKATNIAANVTATKASDTRIESKATTAGAYFRANSAANNYFGLELYHDTTAKWFLGNYVDHASLSSGDFAIVSGAKSNGDVRFKIDSSGNTTFAASITVGNDLSIADDGIIYVGSGNDLQLYHDGTDSIIDNLTGNFYIRNQANDKDIVFICDNGSGGTETYFYMDGSASSGNPITIFPDLSALYFGTGTDLMIRHDGTDSTIANNGGDFYITQNTNDKDLILSCDDGSGGSTAYITLDGSNAFTQIHKDFYFLDSVKSYFGSDGDSYIRHTGSHFDIVNSTGNITIDNGANNYDIIFKGTDDSGDITALTLDMSNAGKATFNSSIVGTDFLELESSGDTGYVNSYILMNATESAGRGAGVYMHNTAADNEFFAGVPYAASFAEYVISYQSTAGHSEDTATTGNALFRLDSSGNLTLTGDVTVGDDIFVADDGIIRVGGDTDLYITHDATNSHIVNATGDLKITQNANDKDIIFNCDDGSGGNTAYITLDGSVEQTKFYKSTEHQDDVIAGFGNGSDLQLYHNGTDSFVDNITGDLKIRNFADDKDIIFETDDGSGGTTAYITLDGSDTAIKIGKELQINGDNRKLKLGAGGDLQFYHTGTGSVIQNATGNLTIQQDHDDYDIIFRCDDGSGGTTEYFRLDGGDADGTLTYTKWADNSIVTLGASKDLRIYHNGTNSIIQNYTGNLSIRNGADDGDIIFDCDDGSGGLTPYITLDGGAVFTKFHKQTVHIDNVKAEFGGGGDLAIQHNGTNSLIENYTGDLYIKNNADDKDIIFQSDDGSGGTETYLFLDGSNNFTVSNKYIRFIDNAGVLLGSSTDAQLIHDGTNTVIQNNTGDLFIKNAADDKDITFQCDDGSGGLAEYFRLDGSTTSMQASKNIVFADSIRASFGGGNDLQIYHDTTNSRIENNTGDLQIQNFADDKDIKFLCDDGSGGTETYFMLDGSENRMRSLKNIRFDDSARAEFGDSGDLDIYHTGSYSVIDNATGQFYIETGQDDGDILFRADDGSGSKAEYFRLDGGNVNVVASKNFQFLDNVKAKLGSSTDMELFHNGSNSFIDNYTGDMYIRQNADDKDLIFQCDDGSGGGETYFYLDGSANTDGNPRTKFPDNSRLMFGAGDDMDIFHNGTNSFIRNNTTSGDLIIQQSGADKDIILKCDDGSGGETAYITLDGSEEVINLHQNITGFSTEQGYAARHPSHLFVSYSISNISTETTFALGTLTFGSVYTHGFKVTVSSYGGHKVFEYFGYQGNLNRKVYGSYNQDATRFADIDVVVEEVLDGLNQMTDVKIGVRNTSASNTDYIFSAQVECMSFGNHTWTDLANDASITDNAVNETVRPVEMFHGLTVGKDDTGHDVKFYGATSGRYMMWDESDDALEFTDSAKITLGSSGDLRLYHDGSHSYIAKNGTGNLYIMQQTNDKDISFQCDDGNGGDIEYFRTDGSLATHDGSANTARYTIWGDNSVIGLGNGNDLRFYHSGTNSFISNYTGDLYITNFADDEAIIFRCDDGSGGVETYFELQGVSGGAAPFTVFPDSSVAAFGSGHDLRIQHDGTDTLFDNYGGHIYFRQQTDDKDIIFQCDNGSGGVTEYLKIDGGDEQIKVSKTLKFYDNTQLWFGNSNDLRIYHDSNNSFIDGYGGHVYIRNTVDNHDIVFQTDDGSGGYTAYLTIDGSEEKVVVNKPSQRTFAKSSTTDGDANGDIVYFGGTTSMEVGKIYYLNSSGNWALTDADAEATAKGMLAVALGSASDTDGMLIRGMVTLDHDPGSVGHTLFLHTTAGQATITAPSGNGDIVRVIGYMLDSTNGQIYFNPDGTFVEVTA